MRFYIFIIFFLQSLMANSQNSLTANQAIQFAFKNNHVLKSASFERTAQQKIKKSSFDLPKANVLFMKGQYNSFSKADNNVSIIQTIPISIIGSQQAVNNNLYELSNTNISIIKNEIVYSVYNLFIEYQFFKEEEKLLHQQDTLFSELLKAANYRYKSGETNQLEKTTAETQLNEIRNRIEKNRVEQFAIQIKVQTILNSDYLPSLFVNESFVTLEENISSTDSLIFNPQIQFAKQQITLANNNRKLERAKIAPELLIGYFNQTLIGTIDPQTSEVANSSNRFSGFQVGLSLNLWPVSQQAKVNAAKYFVKMEEEKLASQQQAISLNLKQAYAQYFRNQKSLDYFNNSALPNAELIIKQSKSLFRNGDIGYTEYLLGLQRAILVKEGYILTKSELAKSINQINYLKGFKIDLYE